MREYTIKKAGEKINWAEVPFLNIDNLLWTEKSEIVAKAQLCYDENAIYVHLIAVEENIRAEHTLPTGMPCEDSCLEFFFSPYNGDERYFNIEFNPNCCMYLGMGTGVHDLVRLLPEHEPFDPHANRTEDGWEVFYSVPKAFINQFFPEFVLESGREMRANCFKCGDLTVNPHFFSWNPVTSETPAFHRPCDFGLMRFE